MNIYSHPEKLLIDHLDKVAENCKTVIMERKWLENSPFSPQIIQDVAYLCGAFHDIGKATQYFQHYLKHPKDKLLGPKNHALISSLFVREIIKIYLKKLTVSYFDKELLITFVYTVVRRHHGGLQNLEEEIELREKTNELSEIVVAFEEIETQEIIDYFLKKLDLSYQFSTFKTYILSEKYEKEIPDFYEDEIQDGKYESIDGKLKIQYFYVHQLLYSTLLFSDKTDVIVSEKNESQTIYPLNGVEIYRDKNNFNIPRNDLDESKNKAYRESIENLKIVFKSNQRIYSITLPTGLGKTLTSLAVGLELRKLNPDLQKLIITIPFTSIIDQNYEIYKEIANTNDSSVILKHHHQAEPAYKIGKEELEPNVSQFLIETWQSEVVVTTFVQLLNSIFSNDKGLLMKLPNLANSIIILDEIQTIDYEHWQLINVVFKELGEMLNCYFILMSATQPLIFEPNKDIIEIVPNYKQYFQLFNRTKIINRSKTPISQSDFVTDIINYAYENPKRDILIILNTKKSCLDVFEKLVEAINSDNCQIYFMSTLITPYERKKIISRMKIKPDEKQRIVVTTQLIEAGVDISVDTIFRAISPIDSIIQASGRANRYNEKGRICEVFIYEIEESIKGTNMVYGGDLMTKTKNVLRKITQIEEKEYLTLIDSYFKEVKKQSDSKRNENIGHINNLAFKKLGKFALIKEHKSESLFVQLNEEAKRVWQEYVLIYENEKTSIFDKRLEFNKIKAQFYNFVVNIPLKFGEPQINFDAKPILNFYLIKLNEKSDFYSYSETDFVQNTGYPINKTTIMT